VHSPGHASKRHRHDANVPRRRRARQAALPDEIRRSWHWESGAPDALNLDHLLADARWQQLVDLLPDGIVLVDKTGFVRYLTRQPKASMNYCE